MDPIATAAATALISAAVTDVWQQARAGVALLLSRGDERRRQQVEARLDATAVELDVADEGERQAVHAVQARVWQARLADFLAEYPDAADELRDLTSRLGTAPRPGDTIQVSAAHTGSVIQTGGGQANTGVIIGDVRTGLRPR